MRKKNYIYFLCFLIFTQIIISWIYTLHDANIKKMNFNNNNNRIKKELINSQCSFFFDSLSLI